MALVAGPAAAQSISIDLGPAGGIGGGISGEIVRLVLLLTVLSLAPGILVMVTSFTRIVVVLSFLRTAIGLQQSPPNAVIVGLSLFLTAFVMAPTFERAWTDGLAPLIGHEIGEEEAFARTARPFHAFMQAQTREKDLSLFLDIARLPAPDSPDTVPLRILVPAFMIGELRKAFEIGFLVFLPFLVIDLVVSAVLMAMGMMMLPPVMVSLPFKLVFFVLVDGWYLVTAGLVQGFTPPG
jgi:flagellar biosynthetic protein FliP